MHSNDNWWLLIGTYAGLIGMNDGFVLRNVQHRLNNVFLNELDLLLQGDDVLYEMLHKHTFAADSLSAMGEERFRKPNECRTGFAKWLPTDGRL